MTSSTNALNFAPYSSPPSSPRSTLNSHRGNSTANGSTSTSKAARPKTPWFSAGSYQSGAKTTDLSTANHISSASSQYHSATPQATSYYENGSSEAGPSSLNHQHGQDSISGDVLWDAESGYAGPSAHTTGATSSNHDAYETVFGWRVDVEAAAAYIAGPLLAIILLIIETRNDYVWVIAIPNFITSDVRLTILACSRCRRFHAWQSLMLGAGVAILHLLFLWSRFFTWILLFADIGVYGNLV